jgi:hypothetical protein
MAIGDSILAKKLFSKVKNNEFKFTMNVIECTLIIQALSSRGKIKDAISAMEWMKIESNQMPSCMYVF